MGSFPGLNSRDDYGPTYEDETPVVDAKRDIGADIENFRMFQQAGASLLVARALVIAEVDAGVVTTVHQRLAWDPNGELALLTWVYTGVGDYQLDFASQYDDWNGNATTLTLYGGIAEINTNAALKGYLHRTTATSWRVLSRNTTTGALTDPGPDPDFVVALIW